MATISNEIFLDISKPKKQIKDKKLKAKLKKSDVLKDEMKQRLTEQQQFFNTEQSGFLEVEDNNDRERTLKVKQQEITNLLGVQNAQSVFNLKLDSFGPYKYLDYTRNGQYMVIASRKGHIALIEWKKKDLVCEFQTKEIVRDIKFLQDQNMYAVAQNKYLYIYDNQGIELHQMRDFSEPCKLEFLPYHFLLCSASKLGFIKYIDITCGKEIAECKTKRGEATGLARNNQNGIICAAHSNGEVTMWTPNMASKPIVKILSHAASPLTSIAVSKCGTYMATTGKDSRFKIWDIRSQYKCLYDYFTPIPATTCDFSDTGLISLGLGNELQIWKNSSAEKQKQPYMKHRMPKKDWNIYSSKFVPYEDVLGVVHNNGFSSVLIPGSGISTFDSYEANIFETGNQRKERIVHTLLEKLDPATISLQVDSIGQIDQQGGADGIRAKEERELEEQEIQKLRQKDKKAAKKMRGRNKIGNKMAASERQLQEVAREKNKLVYLKDVKKAKEEKQIIEVDLEFLTKHDKKFDPIEKLHNENDKKRQKRDFN